MTAGERRVASVRRWVASGRAWVERSFVGECLRRMYEIDARNRAITLAGQAFIAMVPLLMVLSGWLDRQDGHEVADGIVSFLDLEGAPAEAVQTLFSYPPDATGGITLIGFVILLVSVSSFARSLQRMVELAWVLEPRTSVRARAGGFAMVFYLAAVFTVLALVGHGVGPFGAVVQVLIGIPAWGFFFHATLGGRVRVRDTLPAAALLSLVAVGVGWWTHLYMPHLIAVDAQRYGVIGVAFAMVAWLVVVAYVIVGCTLVGAVAARWQRMHELENRLRALRTRWRGDRTG